MHTYLFLFLLLVSSFTALGQSSNLKVIAKKGDGILTLLRRHGLRPATSLKAFIELNKENLGNGNSLYAGRTYLLPHPVSASPTATDKATAPAANATAAPGRLDVPLFGKAYARVDVIDRQLSGAVYYLLAGHGGPDPGAVGKYGPYALAEDEYAYDVTARLARTLMAHGATVYMIIQDADDGIRDENILKMDRDEITYPNLPVPYSQRERLRARTNAVNKLYAAHKGAYQRMLSIHVDSRSESQNIDVFFYHHENSAAGQQLAESIHGAFTSKYSRHQPNRDYSGNVSQRSSLYVVKYSDPPTVFIELGNIRNDLDQRRFVIANNRQALANWISEGIIADYKAAK